MWTPLPMSHRNTKRQQQLQKRRRGTEDVRNAERFSFWVERVKGVKFILLIKSLNYNRKLSVNCRYISKMFLRRMVALRKKSFHESEFTVSPVTALGTLPLEPSLQEISLQAFGPWYLVLSPQFRLPLVHMYEHLIYTHVTNAIKQSNTYSILTYSILTCYCLKATVYNVIGVICSVLVTMYVICLGLVCKRPRCHGMQSDFFVGHDSREWYVIAGVLVYRNHPTKNTLQVFSQFAFSQKGN